MPDPALLRTAVFGASGGIGAALAARLAADPRVGEVHAGARGPLAAGPKRHPFRFDLDDPGSLGAAAAAIGGPLDLVIVATGALHGRGLAPEKSWREFSAEGFARAFALNATGPALVAQAMLPLLPRDRRGVFAALGARVGSIGDNRLGGWTSYRASKAALHQIIRCLAIELARRAPQAVCVALHPGTVATGLSAPYRAGVAPGVLFAPDRAAGQLLSVIDRLTPAQTGRIFAWDGAEIAP